MTAEPRVAGARRRGGAAMALTSRSEKRPSAHQRHGMGSDVVLALRAGRAIGIAVTGLDFLVPDVEGPDHVFIEANERPGLANHEPQPTVARFVDLLFPESRR